MGILGKIKDKANQLLSAANPPQTLAPAVTPPSVPAGAPPNIPVGQAPFNRGQPTLPTPSPAELNNSFNASPDTVTAQPAGVRAGWVRTATGWLPTGANIGSMLPQGQINPLYAALLQEHSAQTQQAITGQGQPKAGELPSSFTNPEPSTQAGILKNPEPVGTQHNIAERLFGSIIRRNVPAIEGLTGIPSHVSISKTEVKGLRSDFHASDTAMIQLENQVQSNPLKSPAEARAEWNAEIAKVYAQHRALKRAAIEDKTFFTDTKAYQTQVEIETWLRDLPKRNAEFEAAIAAPDPNKIRMPPVYADLPDNSGFLGGL